MSPNTVETSLARPSTLNNDGSVYGGSEKPATTSRISLSHRQAHPPVKPVCPVTKIFLPASAFSNEVNSGLMAKYPAPRKHVWTAICFDADAGRLRTCRRLN